MNEQMKVMLKKDDVIAEIGNILNDVSIMGFNDSEIPDLVKLMDNVKNEKIDFEEALKQAYQIKNSKQDYH